MTAPTMFSGAHRASAEGDDIDFYPTQPWGARAGGELIRRFDPMALSAWECACGAGHMVHGLRDYFDVVHASDACLYDGNVVHDFTGDATAPFQADWIVTNPPFSDIDRFIPRGWALARRGVAMLAPARTLEGIARHALMYAGADGTGPRLTVFAPFSERLPMHRAMYDTRRGTAANYAWFLWMKPVLRPRRFMTRVPDSNGGVMLRPAVVDIPPGTKARLIRSSDLGFAVGGPTNAVREVADV